ncbi:MAG: class I SAM-dependent methyltransferase [Veillonella sp.]|nr:class I SAM-dependent methyltransferase [Veillonella sp.]
MATEQEWEILLQIKTSGRDDSHSDMEHHPYEPTDYCVLERLANSGHICKKNTLIDYGSGKGRVSIFMAYQTGCHSIGIEYDERLYEKALINVESPAARNRVSFVLGDAALYKLPDQADRCFFFNPFALHTIKRVLGNIFDSLYHHPREIKLFFYYVNDEVENFLNNHVRLEQEKPIDCSDLFELL